MKTKLVLIALCGLILSGCTLLPSKENAATDTQVTNPTPASSSTPTEIDQVYVDSQTTSTSSEVDSLEQDLNKTLIPDEDLTDILGE